MPSWLIKSALQNVIGRLPGSFWWNMLFQKHVTRGYYPSREAFESKLECCRRHLDHYLKFSPAQRLGFTAFELGTGAWPIVPIGLYLCGASEIHTYDLVPFLNRDLLARTLSLFAEAGKEGVLDRVLKTVQPERLVFIEEALSRVETEAPARLLARMGIHLNIGDARATKLPDGSADLIFSTVVFEHIDADILSGLLKEFRRIASPDAVMSHYVGLADQYASFDKSITPFNFLQFSDRQWRFLNNPIIPQSRLRMADYRKLFNQNGWRIIEERNLVGGLEDLRKIDLAAKFKEHSVEDLRVLFSWMAARPTSERSEESVKNSGNMASC